MARIDEHEQPSAFDEIWRRSDVDNSRITDLERRKHVGVWMNPVFQNSWVNAGDPYQDYQYRLLFTDTLSTRGILTGGASGTVAFTVAEPWRSIKDDIWGGLVLVGSQVVSAIFRMNTTTGEVTVTFVHASAHAGIRAIGNATVQSGVPLDTGLNGWHLGGALIKKVGFGGINPDDVFVLSDSWITIQPGFPGIYLAIHDATWDIGTYPRTSRIVNGGNPEINFHDFLSGRLGSHDGGTISVYHPDINHTYGIGLLVTPATGFSGASVGVSARQNSGSDKAVSCYLNIVKVG